MSQILCYSSKDLTYPILFKGLCWSNLLCKSQLYGNYLLYASNIYNMLRVRNRWISVWTLLISKQIAFNADLISKVQGTQFVTPKFATDWGLHSMNQWRCRVSARLLYQETSAARNTFCIPLPYHNRWLCPIPSPRKMGALNCLPLTVMNRSIHQLAQCSKVNARFEMSLPLHRHTTFLRARHSLQLCPLGSV